MEYYYDCDHWADHFTKVDANDDKQAIEFLTPKMCDARNRIIYTITKVEGERAKFRMIWEDKKKWIKN